MSTNALILPDADQAKTLVKGKTPLGRLNFPHLLTPSSFDQSPDAKRTYSCYLVMEMKHLQKLEEAALAAAILAKKPFNVAGIGKAKNIVWPIRPCEEMDQYAGFNPGQFFVKFSTSAEGNFPRPPVVDHNGDPIEDSAVVCGGAAARIKYWAKAWNYGGREGVSFYLDGTQVYTDIPIIHVGGGAQTVEEVAADFKADPVNEDEVKALLEQANLDAKNLLEDKSGK